MRDSAALTFASARAAGVMSKPGIATANSWDEREVRCRHWKRHRECEWVSYPLPSACLVIV
eukprot:2528420-Rhodomonas_salina.3